MKIFKIKIFLLLICYTSTLEAHTFSGMIGFYDGLSHPVLGMDHFLAMVGVGIISAQIGGKAIWKIPSIFVGTMLFGGIVGILIEIRFIWLEIHFSALIEHGIVLSVILIGLVIIFEKKLTINTSIIFIIFFGLCHGAAHGMEMPWAANPLLFFIGFMLGTATLHLFGVGIGSASTKYNLLSLMLRGCGIISVIYGIYLFY